MNKFIFVLCFLSVLLYVPLVMAETHCNGDLCLVYNQSYTSPLTYNDEYMLHSNDTTSFYFLSEVTSTAHQFVRVYNSSWEQVEAIALDLLFTNGAVWVNDSGTEKFGGVSNNPSTNYIRMHYTNGTYIESFSYPDDFDSTGCTWYNDFYYCPDGTRIERYNMTFDLVDTCAIVSASQGVHHLEVFTDYLLYGEAPYNLNLYDYSSCTELGSIDLTDFSAISASREVTGVVASSTDNRVWLYMTDTSPSATIEEFQMVVNATPSTLTSINPTEGELFLDNNIVMQVLLVAGVNGTLTCYLNSTLFHTNASIEVGTQTLSFPSGALAEGNHRFFCNYTDIASSVYDMTEISFNINTGLSIIIGDYIATLLGLQDQSWASAQSQGLSFLALLLSAFIAGTLSIGMVRVGVPNEGVAVVFVVMFMACILIFSFITWLPSWIGLLIIIICGFGLARFLIPK